MVIVKETFESKHIGQQQQQKENITYMIIIGTVMKWGLIPFHVN